MMKVYFNDGSDNWFYEFENHSHKDNLINIENCLFRNTLTANWITKIISNNITYENKEIDKFLEGVF